MTFSSDKIARLTLGAVLFMMPFSIRVMEIGFAVLAVCFLWDWKRKGNEELKCFFSWSAPLDVALFLFFLALGISVLAADPFMPRSAGMWIGKWAQGILFFLFVRRWIRREDFARILAILTAVTALVCLEGLFQKITGSGFLRGRELFVTEDFTAVRSVFPHYNNLGAFLILAFFPLMGWFLEASKKLRYALMVVMGLVFLNLIAAYSRGAWFSFVAAGVLTLPYLPRSSRRISPLWIFVFMLVMIFALPGTRERALFLFTSGGDEQRFLVWQAGWELYLTSPWTGVGTGTFMAKLPEFAAATGLDPEYWAQQAHNCYFQILVESGPLALGAFLFFAWYLFWNVRRAVNRESSALLWGCWAGWTAWLIHMFLDVHLFSARLAPFFWMTAGLLAAVSRRQNRSAGDAEPTIYLNSTNESIRTLSLTGAAQ